MRSTAKGKSLMEYVDEHAPAAPTLPVTHIMDRLQLEDRIELDCIEPELCDVYNEDIVYLFYGRPSFRPNMGASSSTLEHQEPVCFILRPQSAAAIRRLYPFDTGAHHLNLYGDVLNTRMKRDDFLLRSDIETARKAVSAFFGSNLKYLMASPKQVDTTDLDLRCTAYVDLIRDRTQREVDDRSSAIELQNENSVVIKDNLLAVIASVTQAKNLHEHRASIDWLTDEVEIRHYYSIGRSNPREAFGAMRQEAMRWLDEQGYLV